LFSKTSRHVPLFIEETAMGLIAMGLNRYTKSRIPDFKLSFDPAQHSGHTVTIRNPLTGEKSFHVLCDL
jgi:hypothetical protein